MNRARRAANLPLRRVIPSRLPAVDAVCREMRTLLEPLAPSPVRFAVELLARESLNNAVIHGNRRNPRRRVALELSVGRVWIRIRVADQGAGFNPQKERAALHCGSEPSATSGRGLCIYEAYAQRVSFNRRGNRVAFWVRRHPQEENHAGIHR